MLNSIGVPYYYHSILRKYTVIFGALFSNIQVHRDSQLEAGVTQFIVPTSFAPREKFLERLTADPEAAREIAATLPRISYEIINISYDADRAVAANQLLQSCNRMKFIATPAPWDIHFQMQIWTKTVDEGYKIVEQILPHFRPQLRLRAGLIDQLPDFTFDVPLQLTGVNIADTYEGQIDQRRLIIWTLDFMMKGWLFGPGSWDENGGGPNTADYVIKVVQSDFYTGIGATEKSHTVFVRPGLTADGRPTDLDLSEAIPATAIAQITGGAVTNVEVTNPGWGYDYANVSFDFAPAGGVTAKGTAKTADGKVTEIVITEPGSGYITAPAVHLSSPNLTSISYQDIEATDDYGIVVTIE